MSEGTVFQRSDGRWCAKYKDARGSWRYLYRKSKGEARKALRVALKDRDEGIIPRARLLLERCSTSGLRTFDMTLATGRG